MNIIFLDSEFTALQRDAQLISIALYYSDDCFFYAEMNDVEYEKTSPWIKDNVLFHLEFTKHRFIINPDGRSIKMKGSQLEVVNELNKWIAKFGEIELWADVLAYDWVLFCNIFGGALEIPKNIFYIPFDLSTLFKVKLENPDLDRFEFVSHLLTQNDKRLKHHALMDARVGKLCFDKMA